MLNEQVSLSLKLWMLGLALIVIGTLAYKVYQQVITNYGINDSGEVIHHVLKTPPSGS